MQIILTYSNGYVRQTHLNMSFWQGAPCTSFDMGARQAGNAVTAPELETLCFINRRVACKKTLREQRFFQHCSWVCCNFSHLLRFDPLTPAVVVPSIPIVADDSCLPVQQQDDGQAWADSEPRNVPIHWHNCHLVSQLLINDMTCA